MATTIKLKNSVTTTNAPSSLVQGEVAINVTDKKVWVGNAATTPVQLLGTGSDGSFTNLTVSGTTALNGGATLGDASGDALTINSSAVSIPNGLNFDSNTFVIDATNNRVGVGTASPSQAIHVVSTSTQALFEGSTQGNIIIRKAGTNGISLFSNAAGTLAIYDNDAGSERMRIDSSGNVGIGTSSPAGRLGITTSDALVVDINSTAASGGYMRYAASGTVYGYIGTSTGITGAGGTNALAVRSENSMMFATGGSSERMRIDSSGNLLVGTTGLTGTPGKITTQGVIGVSYSLRCHVSDTGTNGQISFTNPNGIVGQVTTSGSSTTYATSSDYRLKENIAPMTGALATVSALKPVTYTWKVDGSSGQGFIANELQEVVPDCVTGEKDAVDAEGNPQYQGIDTSFLVATLTAAIQEQQAIITEQASAITALEARLTALENK